MVISSIWLAGNEMASNQMSAKSRRSRSVSKRPVNSEMAQLVKLKISANVQWRNSVAADSAMSV
jgi:hypothetical protein